MLKTSIILERESAGPKQPIFTLVLHLNEHRGELRQSVPCNEDTGEPSDQDLAEGLRGLAAQIK